MSWFTEHALRHSNISCKENINYRKNVLALEKSANLNIRIVQIFQIFNFIILFWVTRFISSMTQMILAGAFTTWYWIPNKSDVLPFSTLVSSAVRAFRYHIGTVALGALINYVCGLICSIFGIGLIRDGFGGCMCIRPCFKDRFRETVRRCNGNVYIMCSMNGKGYWASALDAYQLIFRKCSLYLSANSVFGFIFFFTKFLLAFLTSLLVNVYYMQTSMTYLVDLNVIVAMGAYLMFDLFFTVYSTVVDTLMLCARECEPFSLLCSK